MKRILALIMASFLLFSCFMTSSFAVEKMCGDATGDGKINLGDASLIMKYVARWNLPSELEESVLLNGDTNLDERINLLDVSKLLSYLARRNPDPTPRA